MKSCGIIMRVLAVIAAILLCTFTIMNYSLDVEYYDDQREDLAENMEEHEEYHEESEYREYSDEDECSTCESYERQEKNLDRYEKELLYGVIQQCILYAIVWCGLLFILGEIASKVARSKESAPAAVAMPAPVVPIAPVTPVCPKCGSPKQPGVRFCGTCGSFME